MWCTCSSFAKRLNTHGLFCFLSRCLPFFLHPSWWWWWWHWLRVYVCACTLMPVCDCFCDVICDLTLLVCASAVLWLALPMCARVNVCIYLCVCCVFLRGCLSLVSIFIFRKCSRCLQPSTASCKPTLRCTRAPWPNRRSASERRLLACRYSVLFWFSCFACWKKVRKHSAQCHHVPEI